MANMRFAVLIPCGPSALEVDRLTDTISSILYHDPDDCLAIYVMNDGNKEIESVNFAKPIKHYPHPRNGEGWGWGGGLIAGEIWSFEQIAREHPDAECVIKMDTDALVVGSLATRLETVFSDRVTGMAGSRIATNHLPAYKSTNPLSYFPNKVRKLRAPVSLWRKPNWHLRFAFSGTHRRIAQMYDVAEQHGYMAGELIEGSSLAIATSCIKLLSASGVAGRWRDFLDCPVSDDIVLTMLPYFVGMRAVDSDLWCVEPASLRYSPEEIVKEGKAGIVHSLKVYKEISELELRSKFRSYRT